MDSVLEAARHSAASAATLAAAAGRVGGSTAIVDARDPADGATVLHLLARRRHRCGRDWLGALTEAVCAAIDPSRIHIDDAEPRGGFAGLAARPAVASPAHRWGSSPFHGATPSASPAASVRLDDDVVDADGDVAARAWLNARAGKRGATALYELVEAREETGLGAAEGAAHEAELPVAVALLLLAGADAKLRAIAPHSGVQTTPYAAHNASDPAIRHPLVLTLLDRAEEVGGEEAVEDLLASSPASLTRCSGFDIIQPHFAALRPFGAAEAPPAGDAKVTPDDDQGAAAVEVLRLCRAGDTASLEALLSTTLDATAPRRAVTETGESALHILCRERPPGWLRCLAQLLPRVSSDGDAAEGWRSPRRRGVWLVNRQEDVHARTPLWQLAAAPPGERHQLVGVAALLVYGADARIVGAEGDAHGGGDVEVGVLLARATAVGGTRAVKEFLPVLPEHRGWEDVRRLPRMAALVEGAPMARVLCAATDGDRDRFIAEIDAAGGQNALREAEATHHGFTTLHRICRFRRGGAGERGWLGCLAVALRPAPVDGAAPGALAAWINQRDAGQHTALWWVAFGRHRDAASDAAQQLAAVAALLLCGADAALRGTCNGDAVTPLAAHERNGHGQRKVAALLHRAEDVGGDAAVRELLASWPETLLHAAGFALFTDIPAVSAALEAAQAALAPSPPLLPAWEPSGPDTGGNDGRPAAAAPRSTPPRRRRSQSSRKGSSARRKRLSTPPVSAPPSPPLAAAGAGDAHASDDLAAASAVFKPTAWTLERRDNAAKRRARHKAALTRLVEKLRALDAEAGNAAGRVLGHATLGRLGYVYLLRSGASSNFCIGFGEDPAARCAELQASNPEALTVAATSTEPMEQAIVAARALVEKFELYRLDREERRGARPGAAARLRNDDALLATSGIWFRLRTAAVATEAAAAVRDAHRMRGAGFVLS